MTTFKQNTAAPTRKMTAVGIGAVAATMIAATMSASEVAFLLRLLDYPGFESAMGGGLAFAFGYLAKERL
jgi:hypothetical protein